VICFELEIFWSDFFFEENKKKFPPRVKGRSRTIGLMVFRPFCLDCQNENTKKKTSGGFGLTPVARGGCGPPPLAPRPKRGLQLPWDLPQNSLL